MCKATTHPRAADKSSSAMRGMLQSSRENGSSIDTNPTFKATLFVGAKTSGQRIAPNTSRRVRFSKAQPEVIGATKSTSKRKGLIRAASGKADRSEASATWYTSEEILGFRKEAIHLVSQLRSAFRLTVVDRCDSSRLCLAFDEQSRGLERVVCPERTRRRHEHVSIVLDQQDLVDGMAGDADLIAAVSRKATAYAVDLALQEACRDYLRAYHAIRLEHRLEI